MFKGFELFGVWSCFGHFPLVLLCTQPQKGDYQAWLKGVFEPAYPKPQERANGSYTVASFVVGVARRGGNHHRTPLVAGITTGQDAD